MAETITCLRPLWDVISGPDQLRKAALKSVLDWHYNAQTQSPMQVAIDFKLPEKKPAVIGSVPTEVPSGRLKRIWAPGISPALRDAAVSHLPVQAGDLITVSLSLGSEPQPTQQTQPQEPAQSPPEKGKKKGKDK